MDLVVSALRALASSVAWLWGVRDQLRVAVLGAILAITLSNLYFLKRIEHYRSRCNSIDQEDSPVVSVLVPARNEERNIEACASSLLAQDYPRFEVLVLDDDSSDQTANILSRLSLSHDRLRVLKGQPLPEGWLGKHWACHQLALAARGELLLFTDADTRHHPHMLRDAVVAQRAEEADLLTGLPREEIGSWGEAMVIPVIGWAALALLPVGLAHRVKSPLLSMGIGQFMMFRRQVFWAIGGFEAVRSDPVDDMALTRRIKSLGHCWRFVDLMGRVTCRMYWGFRGAADGLGKSVFPALRNKVWVLATLLLLLTWLYLAPLAALSGWLLGLSGPGGPPLWAGVAVCVALASWTLVMWRMDEPPYRAFLYPVTLICILGIAIRSAFMFWRGQAVWKGRALPGLSRENTHSRDRTPE